MPAVQLATQTTRRCPCGATYELIRFYPFSQDECPDCRAKARRQARLHGSPTPIFLRKQAD